MNGTNAVADEAALAAAEAEAAEAEAAEAEALAEAAAARARAAKIRKDAEEARAQSADIAQYPADAEAEAEPDGTEAVTDTPTAVAPSGARRWVPGWRPVAVVVAVLAVAGLLTASGLMIWKHHEVGQRAQQEAEFSAGARQGVVNLLSLNFNNAQADLQRVLDSTTGSFHDDFQNSAKDFATVMADSKVVTTTSVNATGIESMTDDSAVVLVSAKSQVTNSATQDPNPRSWRLNVTVQKEDGKVKMSKVEFVP
jgi:Mce-associated membrane protein